MFAGYDSLECGGNSLISNSTCYGDVTAFTSTVAICNERHLVNASDLVEITGSLRLTFLLSDITALSFENLAVIRQDLYVADVDATTTRLSFPSLVNVSGDITFSSALVETVELSALRACGSLSASTSGGTTNLYFPVLEEVSGAMSFSGSAIRTIELPSLLVIGGSASFSSLYNIGSSIAMPAVRTIGGGLSISSLCHYAYSDDTHASGSIDINSLESIGGMFYMYRTNYYSYSSCRVTLVNASRLQTLGSLYFRDVDGVTAVSMPSLTSTHGQLSIAEQHVSVLTTVSFGSLTTVEGNLYMSSLSALTTMAFESLTTVEGYLQMSSASALTTMTFDSLATVEGYFYISGCTQLGTAYFNSLTSVGQTTVSCDVSGESENVCIRDNSVLQTIEFGSLEYDVFQVAVASGIFMRCHAVLAR